MPTFQKRTNGWQAKIRLAGFDPVSQTFPTKAQAQSWAFDTETKMKNAKKGIVKSTFQDAVDKYITDVCPTHKSGDNEAKRLKAITRMLPALRQIAEITPLDISVFRDKRLTEVSVATVRKEMTILRSLFESARRDWRMVVTNPVIDVKKPPAPPDRKRVMTDHERDCLLMALGFEGSVENLSHQVAVAMLLGLETAMRAGELIGLTWDRVFLEDQFVQLELTKNGDRRDVPLSLRAVELLKLLKGIDPVQVFTVTSESLDALFRKAKARTQIKNLHFHDTRATALTALSKKLDVLELARMVGHRDLKSLMIYYRPTASTLALKLG